MTAQREGTPTATPGTGPSIELLQAPSGLWVPSSVSKRVRNDTGDLVDDVLGWRTVTGTISAVQGVLGIALRPGENVVTCELISGTGTVIFEGLMPSNIWRAIALARVDNGAVATTTTVMATMWEGAVPPGMQSFQARASAFAALITLNVSAGTNAYGTSRVNTA